MARECQGWRSARAPPLPATFDARGRKDLKPFTAEYAGFNVHAGVTIAAHDREGRERLCRYTARPAVCLSRVSVLPDGRVAYKVKYPRSATETHRVMTPVEFMARLAALVPPPRHPLTRYHGVFAPHSPWRAAIVPGPVCRTTATARVPSWRTARSVRVLTRASTRPCRSRRRRRRAPRT